MKPRLTNRIAAALAVLTICAAPVIGAESKETMCVKQKDGTYKCAATGEIMKEPCCETPSNEPAASTPKPKPKK